MITMFVIIGVAVFLSLFAIKVGPNYFEYWTVKKIAQDVANDPDLRSKPRSSVNQYITQAYRTNNLWDLEPEETIELKKDGKLGYAVRVNYEKRDKLFHNIYVVTAFDTPVGPSLAGAAR